ncbi:MAG TPA: AzlC family ABC transporter permease [Spirochaetales bacterium]|nr:AzlC family ABC transporter permease [Spirochaetales bacterium]
MSAHEREEWRRVLPLAVRTSIPVLLGYVPLGIAFGLTLVAAGFPWWLSPIMGIFIFAGAAQFMAIGLMQQGTGILEIALFTLLMNARHIVYGLSMLVPFSKSGSWKPYLIFGLTDETYGLLTTVKPPQDVDGMKFYAAITMLNHLYWVVGCTVGAIVGSALTLDTTGLDFALTALFIVLLVEQIRSVRRFEPYVAALVSCVVALFVGPRNFLLVALALATGLLALLRPRIEKRETESKGAA